MGQISATAVKNHTSCLICNDLTEFFFVKENFKAPMIYSPQILAMLITTSAVIVDLPLLNLFMSWTHFCGRGLTKTFIAT